MQGTKSNSINNGEENMKRKVGNFYIYRYITKLFKDSGIKSVINVLEYWYN
jgi:hypothetical protein